MRKSNDWQKKIDYRQSLSPEDRAWLSQWEKEEYDCSYEGKILSGPQATAARQNKARQARDVLNCARPLFEEDLVAIKSVSKKSAKAQVKKVKKKAEAKKAQLKPLEATQAQLELSFVAYSTAVTCMEHAKSGDKNTENNIAMAMDLFRKMAFKVIDEYAATYGILAAQRLMGIGDEPYRLPDPPSAPAEPAPEVKEACVKENPLEMPVVEL